MKKKSTVTQVRYFILCHLKAVRVFSIIYFPFIYKEIFLFSCLDGSTVSAERWMFDQEALQEYVLLCCQFPAGGLIDKPGR